MSKKFQIAMDCEDPKKVAPFWAKALDFKIQEPPNGYSTWEDYLKDQGVPESEWNNGSAIVGDDGQRIFFRKVPERKIAKNRVRVDINISSSDEDIPDRKAAVDQYADELIGFGASRLWVIDHEDEYWVVLQDVEGNEFSVQ